MYRKLTQQIVSFLCAAFFHDAFGAKQSSIGKTDFFGEAVKAASVLQTQHHVAAWLSPA